MWDQDIRMQELGEKAKKNQEKKLKPLFTSGSGQKRTQGMSLWNLEGMKYFYQVEKTERGCALQWVGEMDYNYRSRHIDCRWIKENIPNSCAIMS